MTFHDLIGTRYRQGVDTTKLMQDVALYNVEVTSPEHAVPVTNRACRVALGDRGVAHLTVSKDTQMMRLAADKRSMGNPGARTSSSWVPVINQPPADQLRDAADVLNSGRKVAVLVGQGALNAREEVTQVADLLGAPVAKALLGKAVLADDLAVHDGRHRPPRNRAILLGDEELRRRAHRRLDHAMVRILSEVGTGAGCADRHET